MLNKDQYNQDEYNDYYKQETEGAEIAGNNDDNGSLLKKIILFLGLIALGIAGYFGFKIFNNNMVTKEKLVIKEETTKDTISTTDEENRASKNKSIEAKVIKTIENNKAKIDEVVVNTEKTAKELEQRTKAVEDKLEETIQKEVATQVQEKLNSNKKMSTDDISKIVDLIMNKMEKEKVETTKNNKDTDLLTALKDNDNSTATTKPEKVKITTNTKSIVKKEVKNITTHNKVTIDNNKNESDDLTQLSEQIKKLLNMAGANDLPHQVVSTKASSTEISTKNNDVQITNYKDSISKEIQVRTNEMRIIVVKPGDTLNKISIRAYGNVSSYQKIFDANPDINRADKIYVGQKLRIPE